MAKRKIVKIDEDKCTGCGLCIPSCHEGALQIVDGKAKLVSEVYCDGLGACLGECPEDAITIEEREAGEFDPVAVKEHLASEKHGAEHAEEHGAGHGHVCPGAAAKVLQDRVKEDEGGEDGGGPVQSRLAHWPVQLALVPPQAPYLEGADVLLAADCVPFAMGDFHRKLLKNHVVLVACPKLDDAEAHIEKLSNVLKASGLKSLSVVHMEVPCCFGLQQLAEEAVKSSGSEVELKEIVVGIDGELK